MKKKNLLLIHLESLNMLNYRMNATFFPNLYKFEKEGLFFNNYYGTGTSTYMIIGDLSYGFMDQYEECSGINVIPKKYIKKESVFDKLKSIGYKTCIFEYPNTDKKSRSKANDRHVVGFKNEIVDYADYNEVYKYVDEYTQKSNVPFAIWAINVASNVDLNANTGEYNISGRFNRWNSGYVSIDHYCGELIKILKKNRVYDDTLIILYGDHGDDPWTHGIHEGLAHAIEPNNQMIHTPLIILNGPRGEVTNRLTSTIDITGIIKDVCVNDIDIDVAVKNINTEYVISRNEYAGQPVRKKSFNKGYSVTDGKYLLLITYDKKEMFDTHLDPGCQTNLLDFFDECDGVMEFFPEKYEELRHLTSFLDKANVRRIRQRYYYLNSKLTEEITRLYNIAGFDESRVKSEMCTEELERSL